jgi:hypothetical protein
MELRRAVDAHNRGVGRLKIEALRVCRQVIADLHNFL